jgi:uncharacterized glyoxalase superfamily protein PhnB
LATIPDPAQPPTSFTTLVGGLPATSALISHDGSPAPLHLSTTADPKGIHTLADMTETAAPGIWPVLRYADAPAAIRFLVEAFGFVETVVAPGEGEVEIAHAELRGPHGGGVMIGSAAENSLFRQLKPERTSIYVVTDTPDALFERATAAGAEVVSGLDDTDYGSRGFTVRDPEGAYWTFGTYRGA